MLSALLMSIFLLAKNTQQSTPDILESFSSANLPKPEQLTYKPVTLSFNNSSNVTESNLQNQTTIKYEKCKLGGKSFSYQDMIRNLEKY